MTTLDPDTGEPVEPDDDEENDDEPEADSEGGDSA